MTRYQRNIRKLSGFFLALAIAMQGLCHLPGDLDFFTTPQFILSALHWELGGSPTWPLPEVVPQEDLPTIAIIPPEEEPVSVPIQETQPPTFSQADCDNLKLGGNCTYPVDKLTLLQTPLELPLDGDAPRVLIIHTHTSEAYAQTVGWEYDETDTARTQDSQSNVVRVGDALADKLIDGGVATIHDTTVHDFPSYNMSYANTLVDIEAWLQKYPTISLVLDIHRDAAQDAHGLPISYTTQIDGVETAQVMIVSGSDQGGLSHPNWNKNLAFALQLEATLNREFPGLARSVNFRQERFNTHATTGSLLLEIGSHGNTLPQALAATEPLAHAILELLT